MDHFTERKSRDLKERSHSMRNIKPKDAKSQTEVLKPSPDCVPLASKLSKEYNKQEYEHSQKSASKNPNNNDHSDYIKNLYKKYLGKENNIQSDKKPKVDAKPAKTIVSREDFKDSAKPTAKLFQEPSTVVIKSSNTQENLRRQYSDLQLTDHCLSRNKSSLSIEMKRSKNKPREEGEAVTAAYKQMLNSQLLTMIGDPRNSLVRCMRGICLAKQLAKLR